jgi:hypothetical protein
LPPLGFNLMEHLTASKDVGNNFRLDVLLWMAVGQAQLVGDLQVSTALLNIIEEMDSRPITDR